MKRDVSAWRQPNYAYDSLNHFLDTKELLFGIHSIRVETVYLDIFINIVANAPLFVFLHGNCPRTDSFYLPVFSGFSVTENLAISTVIPSDPALLLDDDIELSWHAGGKNLKLQQLYVLAIRHIELISQAQSLTFWGGSGGGFASLYYSAQFANSFAFVWNPQTNILKYDPESVSHYAKIVYGVDDILALELDARNHEICLDLCNCYFENSSSSIIYLQNLSDWHCESHLQPFLQELDLEINTEIGYLGMAGERLFLAAIELSEGHEPPPQLLIMGILSILATRGRDVSLEKLSVRILDLIMSLNRPTQ